MSHAVVMETLPDVLEHVYSIDDDALGSLKKELLGVEEGLGHPLDLLVVVMVNFPAVVKHITDIADSEPHLVDGFCHLLERSIPEAPHGVLQVLLKGHNFSEAVADVCHAVEVESSNEKSFDEARDFHIMVRIGSSDCGHSQGCSE